MSEERKPESTVEVLERLRETIARQLQWWGPALSTGAVLDRGEVLRKIDAEISKAKDAGK